MILQILACLIAVFIVWRTAYWYNEGFKIQRPGYLPPPPTWSGRMAYLWLSRLVMRLLVGPVTVIGRENATKFKGRLLINPNHQHGLDFCAVRVAVPFSYRQVGASKEMKGWRAGPAAWIGSFGVPTSGGRATSDARPAMEACVTVLSMSEDAKLLMFPQGTLVYDNILRKEQFRTGWYRTLKMLVERIGTAPLAVLPVAIHYHTDPSKAGFLRKYVLVPLWQLCFRQYGSGPKYGATIVIGEPVPFTQFASDPHAATEQLRQSIQDLLVQAIAAEQGS